MSQLHFLLFFYYCPKSTVNHTLHTYGYLYFYLADKNNLHMTNDMSCLNFVVKLLEMAKDFT